jgi:hypothetical protein
MPLITYIFGSGDVVCDGSAFPLIHKRAETPSTLA